MKRNANPRAKFDRALNMARQSVYRFAALSLLDPRSGSWKLLDELRGNRVLADAAAFLRQLPQVRGQTLGFGERCYDDLDPRRVLGRLPKTEQALNAQYENTFGLLVSGACPPYETEYVDSKFTFQRSNALADLNGFYLAFGLKISSQFRDRPDHVVLQLEFMAHLLGMERRAAEAATINADHRGVCCDAQARFLSEHLVWWTPAFTKLLVLANPRGFYGAAGEFLAALIPAERAIMGLSLASNRPTAPTSDERPELCEGCALSR